MNFYREIKLAPIETVFIPRLGRARFVAANLGEYRKGIGGEVNIAQMIKFLMMKLVHPNSSSSSRLVYMDDHIYD